MQRDRCSGAAGFLRHLKQIVACQPWSHAAGIRGSQGAHAINRAVLDSATLLRTRIPQLHIIHQTGDRDYNDAQLRTQLSQLGARPKFTVYRRHASFFGRADLLLCRSGASTVAEIAAAGKPAVFVPFPKAADDHQKRNARHLEKAGAAVMLEESKLNSPVVSRGLVAKQSCAPRENGRRGAKPCPSRRRARYCCDSCAIGGNQSNLQPKAAAETSRKII